MALSSLKDPGELSRAATALEAAWNEVRSTLCDPFDERERTRLAYIVTSLLANAEDEDDLARCALERYRQQGEEGGAILRQPSHA